ncbi:glycosyltransferase family 4 protein [Desulfopila aestuarii]|uniref:Glycosyltransferase involved in cell wall bisynthesis n=1 Tax=Desulfopila aestuarii DSM 18488 TaxID=1121416 RepID=A0A1M7Y233_9BACT|nr:glycosyltransferase family 4 protein [Desulfopila aestuarii]SHO45962.1 Glycosyltransferase involved in cell wall bisynthesis [Desulfopila aestuarii DSM 18488]
MNDIKSTAESQRQITVMQMLPELDGGGVERGTLEVARYLVKHGHRSLVVSGGGRLVSQLESEGSIHIRMETGQKSPSSLKHILPLRRLMQQEHVDILHLRSRMPAWIGYLAWKMLPKHQRPVLMTTFHGLYSVNAYSAIMTKGAAVIAVSDAVKSHIRERYGRTDNVITIHRGVDGETFAPEKISSNQLEMMREQWGLDGDKICIMLPGRFTRWKGQEVFLKSLGVLKNTNYQAILVGDPQEHQSYAAELERIIQSNNLQDKVKMVGHCADMATAYLLSDIVVSASSSQPEAFGRVSIEAMAMGKPVIATAHGGSLETVVDGETGWLVKPGDADDMAQAIDKALSLSPDERAAMGRRGYQRVMTSFTTEAMCSATLSLYRKMLLEKG